MMYDTLKKQFHPLLDQRIAFYDSEIKRYEKERFYEKNAVARLLRPKTYKRAIKKWLKKLCLM